MQHSHGVEGSETSLLQCFAGQFSQSQLSAVNLRLRGLLLCTLNNHILTTRWSLWQQDLQSTVSKSFRS